MRETFGRSSRSLHPSGCGVPSTAGGRWSLWDLQLVAVGTLPLQSHLLGPVRATVLAWVVSLLSPPVYRRPPPLVAPWCLLLPLTEPGFPVPVCNRKSQHRPPVCPRLKRLFRVILFEMFNSLLHVFMFWEGNCPSVVSITSFAPLAPHPRLWPKSREVFLSPPCASHA